MSVSTVKDNPEHACQKICIDCPFGGPRCGSKGDPTSPIVFVAESPGLNEVRERTPLVGASGRVFHNFVPETDEVYVLNALECYPPRALKKEDRMNAGTLACGRRLHEKVSAHPRRIIVAMGNAALRSLTGNMGLKITQNRGRLIPSPLSELGIMPVVHIAALMKGGGSFRQWKQDIEYAMDLGRGADPIVHLEAEYVRIHHAAGQGYIDALFETLLEGNRELTADIETSGFDHINDRILSVGITPGNDKSVGYDFYPGHLPYLRRYFEDPTIKWAWHNGKFDIKFLRAAGVKARVDDDTMLMSYTLDEEGGVHDLETVATDALGAPNYKAMLDAYLPNKKTSYEVIPPEVLAKYQAIDTSNTAQIRDIYRRRVARDPSLEKLYTRTLLPASEMLAWVEGNGIYVDQARLDSNESFFQEMREEVAQEINELAGYNINAGSPQQVKKLLFEEMRFPNRKKGSTAEDVLVKLQKETEHPIFGLILKHRKAVKMYGTYVKGLRKHVHEDTSRIHATYLLHGTRTGRLAARNPNMQNPPRLPQIRGTFMAAPGYEMVEVDLSQAELRSLAALSGDPDLVRIYTTGGDLHTEVALELFPGWHKEREGAKEERVKCKNVNFGIVYGISPFGLQEQINDTLAEAKRMLDGWYAKYHVAANFIERCRMTPVNNQVITTCFGRKKRVGLVSRENLTFLQNEAANFPHQSIASDITLHAAIRTWRTLRDMGVRIVNMVHDSIIMEVPLDGDVRSKAISLVANALRDVPVEWGITRVPFEADAEVGQRWGSLKEVHGDLYSGDIYLEEAA